MLDGKDCDMGSHQTSFAGVMCLDDLDDYLSSDDAPPECMLLSELDGFLTGLAVGPEAVPPSEWLRLVWGGEAPRFEGAGQEQAVIGAIMGRHNEIVRQIEDEMVQPILWRTNETVTASDWAFGFGQAIAMREKRWTEMIRSEAGLMLLPIMMLCEGEDLFDELGLDADDERPTIEEAIEILPATALSIAEYWRMPASQKKKLAADLRAGNKTGRNDPCPCGSGKKFKKCCGANP